MMINRVTFPIGPNGGQACFSRQRKLTVGPQSIHRDGGERCLAYFSSGYELGSQGIFIEEAFYRIVYSYDRLPRATSKFAARKQNATWPRYNNEQFISHYKPTAKCYSILFSC